MGSPAFHARGRSVTASLVFVFRSRSYLRYAAYASHAVQYMYSEGHRIDVAKGPQPTVALRLRSHAILLSYDTVHTRHLYMQIKGKLLPSHVNFVFEANPCHDYVR